MTEIGNSPIQTTRHTTTGQRQATTFKVVVTLDEPVPDVRPGFTCTAEITTAKRKDVVAVPIQALTVREMLYNDKGELVRETPTAADAERIVETPTRAPRNEPPPGHTRKETEGVFADPRRQGRLPPVKVGHRRRAVLRGARRAEGRRPGHHRAVRLGPRTRRRRDRQAAAEQRRSALTTTTTRMNPESIDLRSLIALQAIWANKLRSFMTVLGNIVAVTSIVTVVTLIQGMNAMVSTPSSATSAPTHSRSSAVPPIRNEDDEERTRNNPLLTIDEGRRDPARSARSSRR